MDKAGNYIKRTWDLRGHILKSAVAGTILTFAFTACSHHQAHADMDLKIAYEFHQSDRFGLSYSIARDAMKDVYAPSLRDGAPEGNPLIGIGETDLNGDNMPEIIAFPTEEEEEEGQYCQANGQCPHYILEVREKKLHTLGVIFASNIGRGDTVSNGYWELFVYKTVDGASKPDVYAYDRTKDQYTLKAGPAASGP